MGATAPTPAVLLPYQQAWVADPAEVAIWEKSRRIGASWCDASQAVLTAAAEGGQDALYIGYSEDMTREYIDDCAMWAKAFSFAVSWLGEVVYSDEATDIKAFRIDFASGKKILALSSRPRSIRGKQGRVTIDEAAFHDDLPGLMKAALAMLIWGGKVRLLSSHNGNQNPFNDIVQDIRSGRLGYSLHRTTFQDAVAQGLYARVALIQGKRMKERTAEAWIAKIYAMYGDNSAEELDVIPSEGSGTFLSMALIESRMQRPGAAATPLVRQRWDAAFGLLPEPKRAVEVAAWCDETLAPLLQALDPARWHGFGLDFARVGDLTVLVVLEDGADVVLRCRLVVELGNCPFRQQEQVLFYVGNRLPRMRFGALDAGGNGAALAEAAADKYGSSRIEQVKLSEAFYRDQMPRLKASLEDATLAALPRDDQCRDDLRAIRTINGVPKLPAAATQRAGTGANGQGQTQRHGDFAIALFLAHYAMRKEALPGRCDGFEAVPRRWSTELVSTTSYVSRHML
jgi:phage FluMu gp28-like protein